MPSTTTITTPGDGTWTAPGTGTIELFCWGAGGSGGASDAQDGDGNGGGGGGGGAFAHLAGYGVTAGTYYYHVGNSDEDSWFAPSNSKAAAVCKAVCGDAGVDELAGAGGSASVCVPTTGSHTGGTGKAGEYETSGWGGGGAGSGSDAVNQSPGGGTYPGGVGGGDEGSAGSAPGGGGWGGDWSAESPADGGPGYPGQLIVIYTAGGSTAVVAHTVGSGIASAQSIVKEFFAGILIGAGKAGAALGVTTVTPGLNAGAIGGSVASAQEVNTSPVHAGAVGDGISVAGETTKEPMSGVSAGVGAGHGVLTVAGGSVPMAGHALGSGAATAAVSGGSTVIGPPFIDGPSQGGCVNNGVNFASNLAAFQSGSTLTPWGLVDGHVAEVNGFVATNTLFAFDDSADFRFEAEVDCPAYSGDLCPFYLYWSEASYQRIDFRQWSYFHGDHTWRRGLPADSVGCSTDHTGANDIQCDANGRVQIAFDFNAATRTVLSLARANSSQGWSQLSSIVIPTDMPAPILGCFDWAIGGSMNVYSAVPVKGALRSYSFNPNRTAGVQAAMFVQTVGCDIDATQDTPGAYYITPDYEDQEPDRDLNIWNVSPVWAQGSQGFVYGPAIDAGLLVAVKAVCSLDPCGYPLSLNNSYQGHGGSITAQWQRGDGSFLGTPQAMSNGVNVIPCPLVAGSVRIVFTLTVTSSDEHAESPFVVAFSEVTTPYTSATGVGVANLSETYPLNADSLGKSDMNAILGGLFALVASSKAAAVATANLAEADPMQAAATALGISNAAMQVLVNMAANADGAAIENAAMQVNVPLNASGTGAGNEIANLVGLLSLAADAAGVGTGSATLGEAMQGSPNATGVGKASAFLESLIPLVGQATGDGVGAAQETTTEALSGDAVGAASSQAQLTQIIVQAAIDLGSAIARGAGSARAAMAFLLPMLGTADGEGIAHAVLEAVSGTHEVYRVGIGATIIVTDAAGGVVTEYLPEGGVVSCNN